MAEYNLQTPLTDEDIDQLRAGDVVRLTGTIYTARDAAHKRLCDLLDKGEDLPFDLPGSVIYYVGPSPAPPGRPIGAAGPTTSYRMDSYAPRLHALGCKASVGKGKRDDQGGAQGAQGRILRGDGRGRGAPVQMHHRRQGHRI
jgi:fumarate hydratase subunit beta